MSDDATQGRCETLELPLRGLASEGAEVSIRRALTGVPGVVAVEVLTMAYRVRVTYEPRPGTREAIDVALHSLGIGDAHAAGEGNS